MATNGYEYGGLRVESAENGFIIYHGSEKYVFVSLKQVLKFIEESFKTEEK